MNLIDYVFISLKRILKEFIHLEHITNSSHTENTILFNIVRVPYINIF